MLKFDTHSASIEKDKEKISAKAKKKWKTSVNEKLSTDKYDKWKRKGGRKE